MSHRCRQALVVDDDAGVREVLADALLLENIDVVPARGAADAIAALDGGCRPSIVLLDLLMPGVSGERLLPLLRQHPAARGVPIIVMSASPERLARIVGPDARLAKPFDLDDLLRTMARLCAGIDADRLVLGLPAIDSEHRKQLALAQALAEALRDDRSSSRAATILDELIDCTRDHFSNECELMRRHSYPESARHLDEHARYVTELKTWRDTAVRSGSATARDAMVLSDSMEAHIETRDRHLARHLEARGVA